MMSTILTVLFSSVVGYGIISVWQRRNWVFQQSVIERQGLFTARYEAISLLSSLVSKRLHVSKNYFETIKEGDTSAIPAARHRYSEVVFEWNAEFPTLVNKIRSLFSAEDAYEFDLYFPIQFVELENHLRKMRIAEESKATQNIDRIYGVEQLLRNTPGEAAEYFGHLYRITDADQHFTKNPKIIEGNLADLSISYLIKNFFHGRVV